MHYGKQLVITEQCITENNSRSRKTDHPNVLNALKILIWMTMAFSSADWVLGTATGSFGWKLKMEKAYLDGRCCRYFPNIAESSIFWYTWHYWCRLLNRKKYQAGIIQIGLLIRIWVPRRIRRKFHWLAAKAINFLSQANSIIFDYIVDPR